MTEAIINVGVRDIAIYATDIIPSVVEQLKQTAAKNEWPVRKAQVMDSAALTFPDTTFTHSLTNLGIMVIASDIEAAKHVYRTTKDDGLVMMSIWDKPLPVEVVTAANHFARGQDAPVPLAIVRGGFDDNDLLIVMEKAGFKSEAIRWEKTYADLHVQDLHLWASVVWSFLGCPVSGWIKEDEEKWDNVIDRMIHWPQKYVRIQETG